MHFYEKKYLLKNYIFSVFYFFKYNITTLKDSLRKQLTINHQTHLFYYHMAYIHYSLSLITNFQKVIILIKKICFTHIM